MVTYFLREESPDSCWQCLAFELPLLRSYHHSLRREGNPRYFIIILVFFFLLYGPFRLIVRVRLWKFQLTPLGAPMPTTKRETPSRERRNCGKEMSGNVVYKQQVPRCLKGSFKCRKSTTWDRRLYFPSEGRHAEDFFLPWKIRRLRSGSNPRTWVPEANMLAPRPPKLLNPLYGTGTIMYHFKSHQNLPFHQ
jgi:hypothetical protein